MTSLEPKTIAQIEELGFVPGPADTNPLHEQERCWNELEAAWSREGDPEELAGIAARQGQLEQQMGRRFLGGLQIASEYDSLQTVIVGTARTLLSCPDPEAICKTIAQAVRENRLSPLHEYVRHADHECTHLDPNDIEIVGEGHRVHPKLVADLRERTEAQITALVSVLSERGVTVLRPHHLHAQEQMFAQDPINVIGDKLVISNMGEPARRHEYQGLEPHFGALPKQNILTLPEGVVLEGGDLMVHNGSIYVGVNGPRTNGKAVEFLRENFPEFKVVPISLADPRSPEDVLHLDCCLGFAGRNGRGQDVLVVYEEGIRNKDADGVADLLANSDIVRVSRAEQAKLGTNFLAIYSRTVISGTDTPGVNAELRKRGIEVIELDISLVKLWGGAFRCLSHPLVRGERAELQPQHELEIDATLQLSHGPAVGAEPLDVGAREPGDRSEPNSGLVGAGTTGVYTPPNRETDPERWAEWALLEGP